MRRADRRRGAAALVAFAVATLGLGACGSSDGGGEGGEPLNVVVILSDDQTAASLERMPWLSKQSGWTRFERGYTNQPWCCPSRANILSGQYAHRSGVIGNAKFAREWDDSESLATSLDDAGYETGLFGKYLNGFPWDRGEGYVPPGWDRFTAFFEINGAYYDYDLAIDGDAVVHRGHEPSDYSTSVLGRRAEDFVSEAPEPFFAFFAPYAPHAPTTAAPRDRGAFDDARVRRPPNFGRAGTGAPAYYRELQPRTFASARKIRRRAWAATLGVDRAARKLVETVRERGALERTVFVYLSDNGYSFGSHRYWPKNCLYEECAKVPFLVRMPGAGGGRVAAPVSNVDLAPTLAALAGADPPPDVDGRDLAPMLAGAEPWPADRDILLEVHESDQGVPDGYAVVNSRYKYAEHATGEVELYDLRSDPDELRNLAGRPGRSRVEQRLAARLAELRGG